MLLFKKIMTLAVAGGLALAASQPAQAAPITGTGSVALFGVDNTPDGFIGLGTTFDFVLSSFAGGTGDLAAVPLLTPVTTDQITATVGTPVSFSASFGSFSGLVVQTELTEDELTSSRVVDVFALGTFTPGIIPPGVTDFDAGPMSLTFSATQTGPSTAAVSASYSIASPPEGGDVPEPVSMTLLGLGLAGSAFVARRRRS